MEEYKQGKNIKGWGLSIKIIAKYLIKLLEDIKKALGSDNYGMDFFSGNDIDNILGKIKKSEEDYDEIKKSAKEERNPLKRINDLRKKRKDFADTLSGVRNLLDDKIKKFNEICKKIDSIDGIRDKIKKMGSTSILSNEDHKMLKDNFNIEISNDSQNDNKTEKLQTYLGNMIIFRGNVNKQIYNTTEMNKIKCDLNSISKTSSKSKLPEITSSQ